MGGNLPVVGVQPKKTVDGSGELLRNASSGGLTASRPALPWWAQQKKTGPQPLVGSAGDPGASGTPPPLFPSSSLAVPAYSSRPNATAKLFLDFDGIAFEGQWGNTGRTPGVVPAYSTDGNTSSFSAGELSNIEQIYRRVAEAFSPFNLDVTTIDPGTPSAGRSVRIVIGGSNTWYGGGGGVAYIASFTYADYSFGTGWVFPDNLGGGNAKWTADATIHEAGHTFGLYHQQRRNADGSLADEYRSTENDAVSAPHMGVAYYRERGVWSNGPIGYENNQFINQLDLAQIGSSGTSPYNHPRLGTGYANGFGVAADDYAGTFASATPLPVSPGSSIFSSPGPRVLSISGVIERTTDVDMFSFAVFGGDVTLRVDNAEFGGMLDCRLLLYTAAGEVLADVNPAISAATPGLGLDAWWTGNLAEGTYFVGVASAGNYGDVGQYTLTVMLPFAAVPEPGTVLALLGVLPLLTRRRS